MLIVSACRVAYLVAAYSESCGVGSGKIGCFIAAVIDGGFEALAFVMVTVTKLLRLLLP